MKNFTFFLIGFLTISLAKAGDPVKVKPTITAVTVFLNRAQLSSSATAYLESGTTDVVLEGLTQHIDPQSIQVTGKGDFIIMGVNHSLNYIDQQKKTHEIIALEDSIEQIQLKLDIIKNTRDVYAKEEQMLVANQSIGGQHNGVSPDALEDMADFYRDRLIEIRSEMLKDNLKIKKISEKLSKYQSQLNEINAARNQPTSQIVVTISNKAPKNALLYIDYVVTNAGWYPLYDLRAKDTKSPIQLMYRAQVYQNTGVEWNQVKLKLSTSNPSLGGTKPTLSAWYLNFYEPYVNYGYDKKSKTATYRSAEPMPSVAQKEEESQLQDLDAGSTANYTVVNQTTLAAEFDIALPYTISSGGKGQLVDVQSYQLPASYKYSAVPKLDKDAFLIAQINGWEDYNLLSGNGNIYFEGTYVGQTFLDLQNTKDTLDISLGRDNKVVIERKTLKEYTSRKLIGSNKKEEFAYEIIVRNNKKDAIEITLEDQIPVSQNSQIEVEVMDTGNAQYDATTGKLIWKLSLNGSDTKSVTFKYSVKYPKNKSISGL
jgi:uncharacterized protein (TIGR02231 family)